ncbi:MAG: hypothetical protein RR806_05095 [Oscillospiraceae bacterium]
MRLINKDKPTRCISPIIKFCQDCPLGWVSYPEWVETRDDLAFCNIESGCILGYDKGRIEDEPTEKELQDFADEAQVHRSKESDVS